MNCIDYRGIVFSFSVSLRRFAGYDGASVSRYRENFHADAIAIGGEGVIADGHPALRFEGTPYPLVFALAKRQNGTGEVQGLVQFRHFDAPWSSSSKCGDNMPANDDFVWVALDYMRGAQISGYRGRMDAAELEAILTGNFTPPFVTLEDVHWVESVWNAAEGRNQIKVTVYGQHGTFRVFKGPVHLRPEHIATIAPMHDCKRLLEGGERFRDDD